MWKILLKASFMENVVEGGRSICTIVEGEDLTVLKYDVAWWRRNTSFLKLPKEVQLPCGKIRLSLISFYFNII